MDLTLLIADYMNACGHLPVTPVSTLQRSESKRRSNRTNTNPRGTTPRLGEVDICRTLTPSHTPRPFDSDSVKHIELTDLLPKETKRRHQESGLI